MARGASRASSETSGPAFVDALNRYEAYVRADKALLANKRAGGIYNERELRLFMDVKEAYLGQKFRDAAKLATEVHREQKRRDGSPYIGHVNNVVENVPASNQEAKIVAMLHDSMEDGGVQPEDLRKQRYPEAIIEAIEAITRPPADKQQMSYQEYIEKKIAPNRIATEVKIADLRDNLRDNDNPEQAKRYRRALSYLLERYDGPQRGAALKLLEG